MDTNKSKALNLALGQIEKQFGKGSVMRLGDNVAAQQIETVSTGSLGLDIALGVGGLPRGRPTLVTGGPGCGKTLFGLEFLVRGAMEFAEPGLFMSFEETEQELTQNAAPLGFDLTDLAKRGLVTLDFVRVEPSEIEETGEYDLEGLFVRLGQAIAIETLDDQPTPIPA